MFTIVVAIIGILISFLISVACDWLLKPLLPQKRKRLYTVIGAALLFLLLYIYAILQINNMGGVITQKGEVQIFSSGYTGVFYPIKYDYPPNLKVFYNRHIDFEITQQRKDGFRIKVDTVSISNGISPTLNWEASGKNKLDR